MGQLERRLCGGFHFKRAIYGSGYGASRTSAYSDESAYPTLHSADHKACDLAFLDVSGRVANALQQLAKGPCAITHPDGMQIRMTRQEIGLIVGCSREMVGLAVKVLAHQGDIEANGKNIVVRGT